MSKQTVTLNQLFFFSILPIFNNNKKIDGCIKKKIKVQSSAAMFTKKQSRQKQNARGVWYLVKQFENCCLEFFEICVGEKVCENMCNVV